MSEKKKHTPGPWKLDQRSGCLAIYPESEDHTCLDGGERWAIHYSRMGSVFNQCRFWEMSEQAKIDARRIVACVNALEEFSTEDIEKGYVCTCKTPLINKEQPNE